MSHYLIAYKNKPAVYERKKNAGEHFLEFPSRGVLCSGGKMKIRKFDIVDFVFDNFNPKVLNSPILRIKPCNKVALRPNLSLSGKKIEWIYFMKINIHAP